MVFAVAAWRGRQTPMCAAAALGWATALACAVGASAGWRPEIVALLVLVVPVAAALLAARLDDSVTTVTVEVTGPPPGSSPSLSRWPTRRCWPWCCPCAG